MPPYRRSPTEPGKIMPQDNGRVSRWSEDHLRVAIVPLDDRDALECIEQAVLDTLDPPFNLDGRPSTDLAGALQNYAGQSRGDANPSHPLA